MTSHETSWLDLIKEHKWTIIVVIICIFAGISYFSMAGQSNSGANPTNSATQALSTPTPTPMPTATATPSAVASSQPSATPTLPTLSGGDKPQAPAPTDWKPVASAFAAAWSNPKVGKDAWLSAIKPTVTSDLYSQFTNTDIERVGQLEVSRISAESEDAAGVNARVIFKDTAFTIMIHLTLQDDMTWLVSVVTSS